MIKMQENFFLLHFFTQTDIMHTAMKSYLQTI